MAVNGDAYTNYKNNCKISLGWGVYEKLELMIRLLSGVI
jgi:hypothetical protein